mgnify:FL=1|tara:strand:+ start:85 stop:669 length:585 start_codon:yes stop_codon:yes gene_type:complete
MFKALFKIFGIIGFLFGLLFAVAFIGTSSVFLYETLNGDLTSLGMFDLGLFMETELGTFPNPVSLIINLFFLFAGFYILKYNCEGFLLEYFNYQFNEIKDPAILIKIKKIIKGSSWFIFMMSLYAFITFISLGIIILVPISLIEWLFDLNITPYLDYYFDKIFLSGSTAFSYLKIWLLGAPLTYSYIKEKGFNQ